MKWLRVPYPIARITNSIRTDHFHQRNAHLFCLQFAQPTAFQGVQHAVSLDGDTPQSRDLQHLPENVLQDPAMLVVSKFERRIYARDCRECLFSAVRTSRAHFHFLSRLEILSQALNVKKFQSRE